MLERTLDELSAPARKLLGEIRRLCEEQAQGEVKPEYLFTRRDLKQKCGWSSWQLRVHLGELEREECIESLVGDRGHQYIYRLQVDEEGKPVALDLSTPEERGGAWWCDVTTLFRRKSLSFSCLARREG